MLSFVDFLNEQSAKHVIENDKYYGVKEGKFIRIFAKVNISPGKGAKFDVAVGDKGGLIAKEVNLSTKGRSWVYHDAKVYGNAKVYGDAIIQQNAQVYDNAQVYGKATISHDAKVHGKAKLFGNAVAYMDDDISGDRTLHGWA